MGKLSQGASGLSKKAETDQVNTLVYNMGDEADDILQSLSLNDEDSATINGVKAKFDSYFLQYMHDNIAITS